MHRLSSGYLFALTNPGSEKALKAEIEAVHPGCRPSYQRRGFVTLKAPADHLPFSLQTLETPFAFARRLCLFLGKAATFEEAVRILDIAKGQSLGPEDLVIHHISLQGRKLLPAGESATQPAPDLKFGQPVGTIVELGPAEFWVGLHRHGPMLSPDPGGICTIALPSDVPSRAWLKLEEAARFFGLTFSPRDIAVELGCAPGGVILALLRRGVSVIGVDPAKLAPAVMASSVPNLAVAAARGDSQPWVIHCRKPAALVGKRDLATRVTWFLSDMNQSPAVALKECARFISMCPSIHNALITLKLTDLSEAADKPRWFQALREMGFHTTRLQQLSVHHHELALLAQGR